MADYNLDELRAVVAKAGGPLKKGRTSHYNVRQSDGEHVAIFRWADDAQAHKLLLNAARAGLLDDAALGRAVRAAAERDGPEREAMLDAARDFEWASDGMMQAAARALIAQQEQPK